MKRFTCPHCGHAFRLKDPELRPTMSHHRCPECNGAFGYGLNWMIFLVMFVPMVLLAAWLRPWMGSWGELPGVLLVIFFSFRLQKVDEDEVNGEQADGKTAK